MKFDFLFNVKQLRQVPQHSGVIAEAMMMIMMTTTNDHHEKT